MEPETRIERRAEPYRAKPLPGPESAEPPPPPFADVPLVSQRPPEQQAFVEAYNGVHRPRIAVFVNRSLLGDSLPVEAAPAGSGFPRRDPPAGYDEASAKRIDYATIENVLTQWLACDGQTVIASPSAVRERLTSDSLDKMQQGRPRLVGDLVRELNADVLVYVQAQPTRQTERGLEIRLNGEAINIQGGEQIARATVLIPPPLDTERINQFTRFVARKLMADMTMTWSGPGPTADATRPPAGDHGVDASRGADTSRVAAPSSAPPPARPEASPPPEVRPPTPSDVRPPTPTEPSKAATDRPPATRPSDDSRPASQTGQSPTAPQEKPSILDRPQNTERTKPAEDFPPPPASARRLGDN